MSQFAVLCEAYLQTEPMVLLFRECFYVNKQTETAQGRHQELGGVSFQKRRGVTFPGADLLSHPKGWGKSWIYCKAPVPEGEHPLPGFRPECLDHKKKYPSRPTPTEQAELKPWMDKISALAANGLEGVDLIRCWLSWKIQPLSRRTKLMHEYSGLKDPQRISATDISLSSVINQMQIIVNLPEKYTGEFGLAPFTSSNPPPAADRPFWQARPNLKENTTKGRKPGKKAVPKPKKQATINPLDVDPAALESSKAESEGEEEEEDQGETETSQHAELRQTDCGGSSTGIGGSDADAGGSHKRPREDTSSDDETSESPDTTFVVKPGVTSKRLKPSTPPPAGSGDSAKASEEITKNPPGTHVPSEPEMEVPADNLDQQPDAVISSPTQEARLSEAATTPPSQNIEGTVTTATAAAPDLSAALGKSSLEAPSSQGRDKLDLSSLESADSDGLHEALQTRLFESQEIAKSLANKQKAQLSLLETQLADSQKKLKAEQELRVAAEERVKSLERAASEAAAKLVSLTSEHEKEKQLLVQRAEDAEKRFQPISAELGGLKLQIRQMSHAIFGPKSNKLEKDPVTQLKAAYTFLEQLYIGSRRAIQAAFYGKAVPSTIKDVLNTLSTLPAQLQIVKESSARIATMHTMARAKAHYEDLDLSTLVGGFPETYKGIELDQETYNALRKETFVPASQLVQEMSLKRFQSAYSEDGKRVKLSPLSPLTITPKGRKDEFAPAIDTSNLIDAEEIFEAFADVNWEADYVQINPSADSDRAEGEKIQE